MYYGNGESEPIGRNRLEKIIELLSSTPDVRSELADEIREQLKDYIFNLRAEEAYVALMDRLKSEIYIDIRTEMVSP